jgi:hypothetical protein
VVAVNQIGRSPASGAVQVVLSPDQGLDPYILPMVTIVVAVIGVAGAMAFMGRRKDR